MPNPGVDVYAEKDVKTNLGVLMDNFQETKNTESLGAALKEAASDVGRAVSSDLRNAAGFSLEKDKPINFNLDPENISGVREHALRSTVGKMSTDNCEADDQSMGNC